MPQRFTAPAAEAKYPWLTIILDTFYISDCKVGDHLAKIAKKGVFPACHRGCDACCKKAAVPFTAPELKAISWYATEILNGEVRVTIKQRLRNHTESLECPFLIAQVCSIYPVRPLICRQFLVKGKPCTVDESVEIDRPNDIIPLPRESVIRPVAMRLLDDFGFSTTAAKRKAFESGFISHSARDMHEFEWTKIAETMERFENEA